MPYAEDGIYNREEMITHLKHMEPSWRLGGAIPLSLTTFKNIIALLEGEEEMTLPRAVVSEFSIKQALDGRGLELVRIEDIEFHSSTPYDVTTFISVRGRVTDGEGNLRGFAQIIYPKSHGTLFETGAFTITAEEIKP